jgi:pimeloyl-ACP methyl ester carboxylesterase
VAVKERIRTHRHPVRLIFGRFDRIIQPSQGYRFQDGLGDDCQLVELTAGHQLLAAPLSPICLQIVTD